MKQRVALSQNSRLGRVIEVHPKLCRVRVDGSDQTLLCSYRRAQVLKTKLGERLQNPEDKRERTPVALGDQVHVQVLGSKDGVVEEVLERRNEIYRLAPGRGGRIVHVLAANLDMLVVVCSFHQPEINFGLMDRFWVAGASQQIPVLFLLNKLDLGTLEDQKRALGIFEQARIPALMISLKTMENVEELKKKILGKVCLFAGPSGVGKTSLFRALLAMDVGRIQEVGEKTQKGRHTTTSAVLYPGPENSLWIDTPGVREFALAGIAPQDLKDYFAEFQGLHCQAPGCNHLGEAGCKAIGLARYPSYRNILESLEEQEAEALDR